MKSDDLSRMKGMAKDAMVKWSHLMIDRMLPDMPVMRSNLKRGANNLVARFDEKLNGVLDGVFLVMGDESGVIDSDTMVDALADIIDEMPVVSMPFGPFTVDLGQGAAKLRFPQGPFWERMTGRLGGYRLTREDFLEMKQFFNKDSV